MSIRASSICTLAFVHYHLCIIICAHSYTAVWLFQKLLHHQETGMLCLIWRSHLVFVRTRLVAMKWKQSDRSTTAIWMCENVCWIYSSIVLASLHTHTNTHTHRRTQWQGGRGSVKEKSSGVTRWQTILTPTLETRTTNVRMGERIIHINTHVLAG